MIFSRRIYVAVAVSMLLIGLILFCFVLPAKKPVIVDPVFNVSFTNGIVNVAYVSGSPLTNVKIIVFTNYNIVKDLFVKKMIPGDNVLLDCSKCTENDLMIQISSRNNILYTNPL